MNLLTITQQLPRYILYTLLIFTPLARASVQPWAVTLIHLLTLIALTAFIANKLMTDNFKWIKTPLDKPLIALFALCLISLFFSQHKTTSLWSLILLINYTTLFYLTIFSFQTRGDLRRLVYTVIGAAAFLALFGLFKYLGANPFPWWDYTDLPANTGRLSSTYGNPDHLAGYMEMALPLILGLFLLDHKGPIQTILICTTILTLSSLLFSLSRGAWLGTTIASLFMATCLLFDRHFRNNRLIYWITGGTTAVILIVLATTPVVERIVKTTSQDPEANLAGRILAWQGTVDMINNYPLTGSGPGTYAVVFTQHQHGGLAKHYTMAHNDYLHVLAEIGLPLALVLAWMIVALYRKGFKKLKNASRLVRGTTLGAMTAVTALLVHSFFDFNLHMPANTILFTVLAAIVASPIPRSRATSKKRK